MYKKKYIKNTHTPPPSAWLVKPVCSRVVFEELDGTEIPGGEGRITRNIGNATLSPPHSDGHPCGTV